MSFFNSNLNNEFFCVCPECKCFISAFNETDRSKVCGVCNYNLTLKSSVYREIFVIFNIANNIRSQIEENIEYYKKIVQNEPSENDDRFCDIHDGLLYKEFRRNGFNGKYYGTLVVNSDGAPFVKSSSLQIWPIQVSLNEVPVRVRQSKPIIAGLWFGKNKPDMNIYLRPFVKFMNRLSDEGISINIDGVDEKIKIYTLCCCVDSAARSPMQGIIQHNGSFGCSWCLHPGVYVKPDTKKRGAIKYVLMNEDIPLRTDVETIEHMEQSIESTKPVYGVKKPSSFIELEKFRITRGFVPDSQHAISLGEARRKAASWFEESKKPYSFTKSEIELIDGFINNLKVPEQITRLSRGIMDRKYWNSREWENWILYYSVPILSFFPRMKTYLKHWSLLVEAFFILNQDCISDIQLIRADSLLQDYVKQNQELYSKTEMTFNAHQLLHLVQSVSDWGPLWAHSGYCFENGNGLLVQKIHAAKGVVHQICRSVSLHQSETILREYTMQRPDAPVHSFIEDLKHKKSKRTVKLNSSRYFGVSSHKPNEYWENRLNLSSDSTIYTKMVKDQCLYLGESVQRLRSDQSHAFTTDGRFIRLVNFIVDNQENTEHLLCRFVTVQNIMDNAFFPMKKIVSVSDEIIPIKNEDLARCSVVVAIENSSFISPVPNLHHY